MHSVFALLCFVVVIHWLIFPYPPGLLHWHCGNLTIAPVPAKQPWWVWINTSYEFIMNDCVTTTKQSTTKPCAYFLGYTVTPLGPLSLTSTDSYIITHRKVSNIRHTRSQNWNDSHLVLKSPLPNPLKPGVKSRMKMYLEQRRQAMLQLHLSDRQFNCPLRCVLY